MIVLSPAELKGMLWHRWFAGMLIGAALTFLAGIALEEKPVIDPHMEKLCRWPQQEGETTVGLVIDGKLRCYVNR